MPQVICVAEHVSDEWVPLAKLFLRLLWQSIVDWSRGFMTARFVASENELVDHRCLTAQDLPVSVDFATSFLNFLATITIFRGQISPNPC